MQESGKCPVSGAAPEGAADPVAAPPVTTGSFQSVLWPQDVANILNLLASSSQRDSHVTDHNGPGGSGNPENLGR